MSYLPMRLAGNALAVPRNGSSEDLLDYNKRGALSHLLAIEEHLQQLPPGEDRSWCVKKHSLLLCDHHLGEAVNHSSRHDPQHEEACRRLRAAAEAILRPDDPLYLPSLGDVARLRNELRAVFQDPTLEGSCPVCSKDREGLGFLAAFPEELGWGTLALIGLGAYLLLRPK